MLDLIKPLRPQLVYAALSSLFINVLLLAPALYLLQVFDRVLSSRHEETLVMLTLALRTVVDAATLAALVVAATVAVVGGGTTYDLGFVGAGLAGVVTGVAVDTATRHQRETEEDGR